MSVWCLWKCRGTIKEKSRENTAVWFFRDIRFQVNTNGVVSFLVEVSQYTPLPFPLGDERRLISPFWGDVDSRNGGTVSYRESTDPVLLQRATKDVRRAFLAHQKFSATWIFIATWDRVAFFGASGISRSKVMVKCYIRHATKIFKQKPWNVVFLFPHATYRSSVLKEYWRKLKQF